MMTLVLAHQGGWDEVVFILVPISIFAGLLALANRRAIQLEAQRDAKDHPNEDPAAGPPS